MKEIFYNANVYSGSLPLREAFVVEDGRFLFVGDNESALALAQEGDSLHDLEGKFVCPGFNDSHMHLLGFGGLLSIAQLGKATGSLEEMLGCLRDFLQE
ncbi:MAG: amidohydrolase family protein, partial [Oscillospiraceae bacterium]|nr:amidohydrolase family protein [Oscillospiraceae bacterium]